TRVSPRALREDGSPAAPVTVTWKSLRPDIASVDQNGVVVALAPGQGTVQVTGSSGLTATAPVVVQQSDIAIQEPIPLVMSPGDVDTLHVVVPAQGGRVVSPLALQWSAADPGVARVSLTGVVTAVAPGRTTLNVVGLLQTKPVDILVHKTVEALTVFPTSKTDLPLPIQGMVKFQVQALAADKTPVPEAPFRWTVGDTSPASFAPATGVTWTSDNPQVVAVAEDGTVSTASYGHAHITATAPGGRRAAAEVFVQGEIVVASSRTGRFQLYAAERANLAQLRKIMDDTAVATEPAFSPDGSRIAFTSTRDGQPEIYIMDADGTSPGRLTNSPGADGDAAFTADGQSVVFHSQRTGHRQIFLQPITSSDAVQLTQEPADNSQPTVSPDGETIAFVSNREGNNHIWLMSKDGANPRPLTRGQQSKETAPHFLRDGSLAYLLEQKESGRTVTQVVKVDLPTGK